MRVKGHYSQPETLREQAEKHAAIMDMSPDTPPLPAVHFFNRDRSPLLLLVYMIAKASSLGMPENLQATSPGQSIAGA